MDWGTEVQTLLAVVVGGVITFGATYWLERRREESARKEGEERQRADTRVAAMLVGYELLDAQAELIGASSLDTTPPRLSDEQWRQWAPTLARGLSREEWAQVATAFDRVTEVNRELPLLNRDDSLDETQERDYLDHIQEMERAWKVLAAAQDLPERHLPPISGETRHGPNGEPND